MKSLKTGLLLTTALWGTLSVAAEATKFVLTSTDITEGKPMNKAQEFAGFGCTGSDLSPQLSWSGAPEGTVAYAITAYDPDAPTGSGWWHWQVVNIPGDVTSLATGAGKPDNTKIPKGASQIENDFGVAGFGGACPPEGDKAHRYQFTVHALSHRLELPANASGALTGYMISSNSLGSSKLEALYKRD